MKCKARWRGVLRLVDALVITPAAIGGAVDIFLEEWDNLSESSG